MMNCSVRKKTFSCVVLFHPCAAMVNHKSDQKQRRSDHNTREKRQERGQQVREQVREKVREKVARKWPESERSGCNEIG